MPTTSDAQGGRTHRFSRRSQRTRRHFDTVPPFAFLVSPPREIDASADGAEIRSGPATRAAHGPPPISIARGDMATEGEPVLVNMLVPPQSGRASRGSSASPVLAASPPMRDRIAEDHLARGERRSRRWPGATASLRSFRSAGRPDGRRRGEDRRDERAGGRRRPASAAGRAPLRRRRLMRRRGHERFRPSIRPRVLASRPSGRRRARDVQGLPEAPSSATRSAPPHAETVLGRRAVSVDDREALYAPVTGVRVLDADPPPVTVPPFGVRAARRMAGLLTRDAAKADPRPALRERRAGIVDRDAADALGRVDAAPDPGADRGDLHEAEDAGGGLVVTVGDAASVLEAVEAPPDPVSQGADVTVDALADLAAPARRNDGDAARSSMSWRIGSTSSPRSASRTRAGGPSDAVRGA